MSMLIHVYYGDIHDIHALGPGGLGGHGGIWPETDISEHRHSPAAFFVLSAPAIATQLATQSAASIVVVVGPLTGHGDKG